MPLSLSPAVTKYRVLLGGDDCGVSGVVNPARKTKLLKVTSTIECWQEETSELAEASPVAEVMQASCTRVWWPRLYDK